MPNTGNATPVAPVEATVARLAELAAAAEAHVDQAEAALREAKAAHRAALDRLADKARCEPDARAAWHIYWETSLPTYVAAGFLGLPKTHASQTAAALAKLLPPPHVPCPGRYGNPRPPCRHGAYVPLTSREKKSPFRPCDGCQEDMAEELRERARKSAHLAGGPRRRQRPTPASTAAPEEPLPTYDDAAVAALRSMPYAEYLRTEHWRRMRLRALRGADYACQVCSAKLDLNVHHRTYERRGCERDSDLTVLCRQCHATFHGKEDGR